MQSRFNSLMFSLSIPPPKKITFEWLNVKVLFLVVFMCKQVTNNSRIYIHCWILEYKGTGYDYLDDNPSFGCFFSAG